MRGMTSTATSPFLLTDDSLDVLFREARTANTFTDEPVSAEQVREVWDVVRFGPTAMNNQPLRLLLVESAEARERLAEHMAGNNRPKTRTAPLTAVLAADVDFHELLPHHFPHAPGVRDALHPDAEGRAAQAEFNAALQIGYLILGLRAAGLATGPMAGFDKAGVDAEFLGGTSWRSVLVMNIGRPGPDAWADRLPRLSFDDAARVV